MVNIARGGQAARTESQKKFSSFKRTEFLNIKDGESIFLRFIDDGNDWPYLYQHGFVPTKGAPPDWKSEAKDGKPVREWPATKTAVCRKQLNDQTQELVFPDFEGECFICDHMKNPEKKHGHYYPSVKLWARAIVREAVLGTEQMVKDGLIKASKVGAVVGYRDKMVEQQDTDDEGNPTGPVKKVPVVIVVNQGMKNFFSQLQAYFDNYGTVLDRDYKVGRRGEQLATEYDIVPLKETDWVNPETEEVEVWSLENPDVRAPYAALLDLEEVIEEQASDRYFDLFFDNRPGHEHPVSKKDEKTKDDSAEDGVGTAAKSAPVEDDEEEQDVEEMRRRLAAKAGMLSGSDA